MSLKKKSEDNPVEILVVEDSPTQAERLRYILEMEGYQVTVARNGKEALSLLSEHRPTAVISDIVMPEMDGYQLCRQIKADQGLRSLPVILLTALSDSSDVVKALECGADNFLTKPYEEKYLLSRLQYFLINQELRKTESIHMGLEIFFQGQKFLINSDRMQILNLLLSTYEAAVQKNDELIKAQDDLRKLNEGLEEKVKERTAALTADIAQRKRAEEAIEGMARFPSENPSPVLRVGRDGTLLYANEASHAILRDWQLDIGKPAPLVLRETASETLTQQAGKIIDTQHGQRIISFFVAPVVNGGYTNFYGRDITERKHAEEELWKYREHLEELVKERTTELAMANEQLQEETTERKLMGQLLRESAERSRFALDVIETGYWDLDLIDHTAQRSLKHDQIFGYETLLPQWTFEMFLEHVVPEDRAAVNQKFQQAIESKGDWNFECRIIRRDGEQRWILAHGRHRLDPSGQLRLMGGIVQDITERRKLEEAHSKLAAIVESADDAIIAEDLEGIIVSWNKGAEIVYGYNAKEIVGKSVSLLMAPSHPDGYMEVLAKIARGETTKHYETQRRRKNGQTIDVSLTISPLKDTSGKIIGASIIARDVTEEKKLERGMAQARDVAEAANKELEAFSYSVSHDLRAPLRSIDGFSQALLEDYQDKLDDTAKSYLDRVRKATQHMGRLIDDMLKLSRVTRSGFHHASVDMSTMVREISEKLQQNDPVRTVDVIIREGVFVNGDSNLLKIALENLVNNAWKFTSKEARPQFEFGTTVKEGKTACFIRDNGVGFDMTYVNKLFGAFQRLHTSLEFPGTGIGLATVQRIINRHGGQVWAEAEVGKGATFYFTLPG